MSIRQSDAFLYESCVASCSSKQLGDATVSEKEFTHTHIIKRFKCVLNLFSLVDAYFVSMYRSYT